MFDGFNYFLVLYTYQNNLNNVEHIVGFQDAPTILETKGVLDEAIDNNLVPSDVNVYMAQLSQEQAKAIFMGQPA